MSETFITCPKKPTQTLGLKLPFFTMVVKNIQDYFSFEIQIKDETNVVRRFRASNFQVETRVKPYLCAMPLRLDEDWNIVQFNLADLCKKAYGIGFQEVLRVQVGLNLIYNHY